MGPTYQSSLLLEAYRSKGKGGWAIRGWEAACDNRYPHGMPKGWTELLWEEVDNAKEPSVM